MQGGANGSRGAFPHATPHAVKAAVAVPHAAPRAATYAVASIPPFAAPNIAPHATTHVVPHAGTCATPYAAPQTGPSHSGGQKEAAGAVSSFVPHCTTVITEPALSAGQTATNRPSNHQDRWKPQAAGSSHAERDVDVAGSTQQAQHTQQGAQQAQQEASGLTTGAGGVALMSMLKTAFARSPAQTAPMQGGNQSAEQAPQAGGY